jgi:cobalt/nickel transport system permease protein
VHHVVLERWSTGSSILHRRDPRVKLAGLLVFLIVLATAQHALPSLAGAMLAMVVITLLVARVPLIGALMRAGVVLPFSLLFGAICWSTGDPARGLAVVLKSYVSALAVLAVVSTTPMPLLLRGLEAALAPRFLLLVTQFLYRYLFVVSEEAQHMRVAASARGGATRARFRASTGALAVLFARSYSRAEEIHRAMLARAFDGRFHTLESLHYHRGDGVFLAAAAALPILLRLAIERLA